MTGSKPRRGLSSFLSAELNKPRAEPEAPKSVTPTEPKPVTARRPEPKASDPSESVTARPPVPPSAPPTPPPPERVEVVSVPPAARAPEVTNSGSDELAEPLYQRLTRKEVRFRDDQLEGLDRLTRRLSRARRGFKGERLTENTLVRVAVDLLLEHTAALSGTSEGELLASLRQLARKAR